MPRCHPCCPGAEKFCMARFDSARRPTVIRIRFQITRAWDEGRAEGTCVIELLVFSVHWLVMLWQRAAWLVARVMPCIEFARFLACADGFNPARGFQLGVSWSEKHDLHATNCNAMTMYQHYFLLWRSSAHRDGTVWAVVLT